MTIVQDAKTLTMTLQSMRGNDVTLVFNLDGTDSKRTMTRRRRQPVRNSLRAPSGMARRSSRR